ANSEPSSPSSSSVKPKKSGIARSASIDGADGACIARQLTAEAIVAVMAERARSSIRCACLVVALAACSGGATKAPPPADAGPAAVPVPDAAAAAVALPPYRTFPSVADALRVILDESRPRVLGFGEYHQKVGTAAVGSALSRFTAELLPVVAAR